MNIETFMSQMNTEHKESVVQKHIIKNYIPLEIKIATAKKIVEASCYKDVEDSQGNKKKVFWANSVLRHFLTIRALIECYTDLTFSKDPMDDYNMLAEKKYDAMILAAIPVDDAEEFTNIVDMVYDDEYENVNSVQGRVKNFIDGFEEILGAVMENMALNQLGGGNIDGEEDGDRED